MQIVSVMNDKEGYYVLCPECGEHHKVNSYAYCEIICDGCGTEFCQEEWG